MSTHEGAAWRDRWLTLASYPDASRDDDEDRITQVIALWRDPVPKGYARDTFAQGLDDATVRVRRTTREPPADEAALPSGDDDETAELDRGDFQNEHDLEADLLAPQSTLDDHPATVLGDRLVDGVNAVALAYAGKGNGRRANVEADLALLLRGSDGELRCAVGEAKTGDKHAWYAVVENLMQLRLAQEPESAMRRLFLARKTAEVELVPQLGLVIAPVNGEYYTRRNQKLARADSARLLISRIRPELGVDVRLTTWDRTHRRVEDLGAHAPA